MYYYFKFCRTTHTTHESIAITQPIFLFNRLLKSRRRNRLMKKVSKLALQSQTIHFLTLTLPPPNYCHTVSFTTRSIGGVNKQTLPAGQLQLHIQSCEEIECKYYINVAGLVLSISTLIINSLDCIQQCQKSSYELKCMQPLDTLLCNIAV